MALAPVHGIHGVRHEGEREKPRSFQFLRVFLNVVVSERDLKCYPWLRENRVSTIIHEYLPYQGVFETFFTLLSRVKVLDEFGGEGMDYATLYKLIFEKHVKLKEHEPEKATKATIQELMECPYLRIQEVVLRSFLNITILFPWISTLGRSSTLRAVTFERSGASLTDLFRLVLCNAENIKSLSFVGWNEPIHTNLLDDPYDCLGAPKRQERKRELDATYIKLPSEMELISFRNCRELTLETLAFLKQFIPRLKKIEIENCSPLDSREWKLKYFKKAYKDIGTAYRGIIGFPKGGYSPEFMQNLFSCTTVIFK